MDIHYLTVGSLGEHSLVLSVICRMENNSFEGMNVNLIFPNKTYNNFVLNKFICTFIAINLFITSISVIFF